MSFNYGETILPEGLPSDRVYILKTGECSIQRKVNQTLFQKFKEEKIYPKIPAKFAGNLDTFAEAFSKTAGFYKSIDICLGHVGDLIGIEACVEEEESSFYTYRANSQPTVFYYISKQELLRYFKPVLPVALEHAALRNLTRLRACMTKLEKILQLGTRRLLEHSAKAGGPVYLSGKTDAEKFGNLAKNQQGLDDNRKNHQLSEKKMDIFLKNISGLVSKDANRNQL